MNYSIRKELYKKIVEKRGRPLITYVTSIRPGLSGSMSQDVIPIIIEHINKIPKSDNGIDILILSTGGDPIVSWRIISLLRQRFKKVGVIIPYMAYSAATLLALGADEILMHPYANLGPVDPQLVIQKPNQPTEIFGYEDIKKYVEFTKDIGISDQDLLQKCFEKLTNDVGTIKIGVAKRGSQLALSMSEKLLNLHMTDSAQAKAISETLNTAFYHHGYPLSLSEAKDIGLNIIDIDEEMENLMWDICNSFSSEMKFKEAFNPNSIIVENMRNNPINIGRINQISEDGKIVFVESENGTSYLSAKAEITYAILQNLNLSSNTIQTLGSWKTEMEGES